MGGTPKTGGGAQNPAMAAALAAMQQRQGQQAALPPPQAAPPLAAPPGAPPQGPPPGGTPPGRALQPTWQQGAPQQPWNPQASNVKVGGPQAGVTGPPPVSPQGFNQYSQLASMPITGHGTRQKYNQAAKKYISENGKGFDPNNVLQRTNALRNYGG